MIAGFNDGTFGPNATMTRAQMATVVCRLMEYAPRGEVKFEEEKAPVVQNGDYFYESGMVKREVQKDLADDMFKAVKLSQNEKGELCLAVDAVTLPKELVDAGWKWSVSVWGYKKEHVTTGALELGGGGYTLSSGESGPLKVLGYEGSIIHDIPSEPDMVKDIDWLQVRVSLYHKDYSSWQGGSQSQISFKTASTFTTQGYYAEYPNASLNTKPEWVDMDLSFMFKNVGLTK